MRKILILTAILFYFSPEAHAFNLDTMRVMNNLDRMEQQQQWQQQMQMQQNQMWQQQQFNNQMLNMQRQQMRQMQMNNYMPRSNYMPIYY